MVNWFMSFLKLRTSSWKVFSPFFGIVQVLACKCGIYLCSITAKKLVSRTAKLHSPSRFASTCSTKHIMTERTPIGSFSTNADIVVVFLPITMCYTLVSLKIFSRSFDATWKRFLQCCIAILNTDRVGILSVILVRVLSWIWETSYRAHNA